MATLTETGIVIESFDSILTKLEQGFRAIYGKNINLDADTPDGQMLGLIAQIRMDYEELAQTVYNQLDPDYATGVWLEQRVAYAGLMRRTASYSHLRSVILTGEPYTNLYAGITVSDPNKIKWVLVQDVQLDSNGSARADFRSLELGAFSLPEHQPLIIETITLGLSQAVTSASAELGSEEETDSELRSRFFLSRNKNAVNSIEALTGKIASLADVRQVKVLENNTNLLDTNQVQPHSINVVVDGGEDSQIAQTIFENKGVGVGVQGEYAYEVMASNKQRHQIRFDRARPVDIRIAMVLARYDDFTQISKDDIIEKLTTLRFEIGEDVRLSRLYSPINQVSGFYVQSLQISRKNQPLANSNIEIAPRELARILTTDIQITVV